jgi:hypothetical protein
MTHWRSVRRTVGAVLVGGPREVQRCLESVEADLVIALAVDQTDARRAKLVAKTLASVVPLVEAQSALEQRLSRASMAAPTQRSHDPP